MIFRAYRFNFAYKHERYVEEACVRSVLAQTYPNIELIGWMTARGWQQQRCCNDCATKLKIPRDRLPLSPHKKHRFVGYFESSLGAGNRKIHLSSLVPMTSCCGKNRHTSGVYGNASWCRRVAAMR